MEVRGLGQLLAALAAALFVRAVAGPGPALLPPADDEDSDADPEAGGEGGGVPPVTIRWARITCALKNKRGDVVSRSASNHPFRSLSPEESHWSAALRARKGKKNHLLRISQESRVLSERLTLGPTCRCGTDSSHFR